MIIEKKKSLLRKVKKTFTARNLFKIIGVISIPLSYYLPEFTPQLILFTILINTK